MMETALLDLPTLFLSDLLIALLLGSVLLLLSFTRTSLRAVRLWRFAILTIGAALILTVFQGYVSTALSPPMVKIILIIILFLMIGTTLAVFWMEIEGLDADLKRQAMTDPLTGALNRRAFVAECDREISRCRRRKDSFAIALFNLDHFQVLNDTYGYVAGDVALCNVVFTIRQVLRSHDVLARIGGEEFAILLPGASDDSAARVAQRLVDGIASAEIGFERWNLKVTASCGIAIYPQHGEDWGELLTAANQALYEAKGAGRNRVVASVS
jgi:diguanylate cyclase (GGDEF)-like protein